MTFEHDIQAIQDWVTVSHAVMADTVELIDQTRPFPVVEVAETISALSAVTDSLLKQVCLNAVDRKVMSRKNVADIMQVHPHTISRWLTARETEQPE